MTGYRLRMSNRRLRIRVRRAIRMWAAHVRQIAPKAYLTKGRFAKLLGEYEPGTTPNDRQNILSEGARIVDAGMNHAVMSYEGSVRLLTFKGGQPLPWSSMVLARTGFEATLRVLWILDPMISDDLLVARIAATIFEELDENRKILNELPEELAEDALKQNQLMDEVLRQALANLEFLVTGSRRGTVTTPTGEVAAFPFVMVDASNRWWSQVGVHTYRWLSGFTHAGSAPARQREVPVAAVDATNTYLVLGLLTDAVWKAMDSYSMWVGMPIGLVRRKLANIYGYLRKRAPGGILKERPPSDIERAFLEMAAAIEETGLAHPKLVRRFIKNFVRRIDM